MRSLSLVIIFSVAVAGCNDLGGNDGVYPMSVDKARSKLLAANFARGILPGSSILKPKAQTNHHDGTLEWTVLDDSENGSGWWCPFRIEPAGEDGKSARVINECRGMLASKNNADLDELVDATLTGREPKFD